MLKTLDLLFRLQELVLLQKELEVTAVDVQHSLPDSLVHRTEKVRRQLPGPVLSQFDRLAQRFPDPVATVYSRICQGCHQELSPRLVSLVERSGKLCNCEHCGRFMVAQQQTPDYVLAG